MLNDVRESPSGSPLRLESVTKSYGASTVLHRLDLSLIPGELICLLGPSGCGKTTALRCIAGLEQVSSGHILISEQDVTDVPVNRRDIGMVFQQYSLFPHLTAAQNVEFGLQMRKLQAHERTRRVNEMLDIVGLTHLSGRFPHEMSGGQQQRVALARALVTRPRALLLDEPLSALDAKVRVRLREQIRAIQTELGITTVFVTHDQEEALAVSDRVAVMEGGQIAQLGSPEDLYRRPASAFVADFVGLSNRIPGVIDSHPDGRMVRLFGEAIPLLENDMDTGPVGTAVTAFVRPEHVQLSYGDQHGGQLEARVVSSGFLGSIRRTVVELADGTTVAAQHSADEVHTAGEVVRVSFMQHPVPVSS